MARRGFSLLELVVVLAIIGLLIALALERLLALRVEAERVVMEEMLGSLRAGVAIELVSLLAKGRDHEIVRLDGGNPMDSLVQAPRTYIGELDAIDLERIPAGRWYFDRANRVLVYRVRYGRYFETDLSGPARARFREELAYRDHDGNGRFDPDRDDLHGVRIRAVEPYRWLHDSSLVTDFGKKQ